jgi:hypothetical protein
MPFNDNSNISDADRQIYVGKWVAFISKNSDISPLVSVIIANNHCLELCNQSEAVVSAIAQGENVINEFIAKPVATILP